MPAKSSVDPVFERAMRSLRAAAAAAGGAVTGSGNPEWFRPEGWNGDPFDAESLAAALTDAGPAAQYLSAISDADNPGTSADLVAAAIMSDSLNELQRAMTVRHTYRRCRCSALAAGRDLAAGSEGGVFTQNHMEEIRQIVERSAKGAD